MPMVKPCGLEATVCEALVSMQVIVDALLATLPQELLNRPHSGRCVKPPAPLLSTGSAGDQAQ
jgi:hypothetical protein